MVDHLAQRLRYMNLLILFLSFVFAFRRLSHGWLLGSHCLAAIDKGVRSRLPFIVLAGMTRAVEKFSDPNIEEVIVDGAGFHATSPGRNKFKRLADRGAFEFCDTVAPRGHRLDAHRGQGRQHLTEEFRNAIGFRIVSSRSRN